ncbi:unnamed protein product [Blepharisma stoltei]|uniref:MORN repeat-containing protein 5 n=1 Tax=Blepharisma stoltei TaxID=1481888 RepID=A0AAU9JE55_9CILI|nr:unnamed protein product [Blepharisma stoltei]
MATITKAELLSLISDIFRKNPDDVSIEALRVLVRLLTNIQMNPTDPKFRSIKKTNETIQKKLLPCEGVLPLIYAIGYKDKGAEFLTIKEKLDNIKLCLEAIEEIKELRPGSDFGRDSSTPNTPIGGNSQKSLESASITDQLQAYRVQQSSPLSSLPKSPENIEKPPTKVSPNKRTGRAQEAKQEEDHEPDFKLEWSGSSYDGPIKDGWFEGFGRFRFPKGVVYEGEFHKGEFHGKGTLIFPNGGRYKASWDRGRAVDGEYEYYDGLKYNAQDWNYCKIPDRRFYTEIKEGLRPAGATLIVNDPQGPNEIPPGTYDIGEGYYDPSVKAAYSYEGEELETPMDSDLIDILKKYRYNPAEVQDLSDEEDLLV